MFRNLGNIALLGMAAKAGLIPDGLALKVANAYRVYREHQHRIRLDGADKTRISLEDMDQALIDARTAVRHLWQQVLCA